MVDTRVSTLDIHEQEQGRGGTRALHTPMPKAKKEDNPSLGTALVLQPRRRSAQEHDSLGRKGLGPTCKPSMPSVIFTESSLMC